MSARELRYALIFERVVEKLPPDVLEAHQRRLVDLERCGIVIAAGPFEGGGGLVILDVESASEAESIAQADPFVLHGTHHHTLRRWMQDLGRLPGRARSGRAPGDGEQSGRKLT